MGIDREKKVPTAHTVYFVIVFFKRICTQDLLLNCSLHLVGCHRVLLCVNELLVLLRVEVAVHMNAWSHADADRCPIQTRILANAAASTPPPLSKPSSTSATTNINSNTIGGGRGYRCHVRGSTAAATAETEPTAGTTSTGNAVTVVLGVQVREEAVLGGSTAALALVQPALAAGRAQQHRPDFVELAVDRL